MSDFNNGRWFERTMNPPRVEIQTQTVFVDSPAAPCVPKVPSVDEINRGYDDQYRNETKHLSKMSSSNNKAVNWILSGKGSLSLYCKYSELALTAIKNKEFEGYVFSISSASVNEALSNSYQGSESNTGHACELYSAGCEFRLDARDFMKKNYDDIDRMMDINNKNRLRTLSFLEFI